MRVTCPACSAECSLEALLGREVDARAAAGFIERNVVMGELMVRYIALFRPGKRRLGIARMVALIDELLPDLQRGAINRKGREWAAPREAWKAAFEVVLAKRDKGDLALPLTTHGLLYEVLVGAAEKAERRDEASHEEGRRHARPAGPVAAGPRNLADVAGALAAAEDAAQPAGPAVVLMPPPGPSKAALAIRAQNEEHQRRRGATKAPEPGEAP